MEFEGWRDNSVGRSTSWVFQRSLVHSQHPHDCSQLSVPLVPGDMASSSGLCNIYMLKKHELEKKSKVKELTYIFLLDAV